VILTREIAIEQPDGRIITGHVGDYVLQAITGDRRSWVLPWDYFEQQFSEISNDNNDDDYTDRNLEKASQRQVRSAVGKGMPTMPLP
jgi:hypothetical protein